MTKTIDIEALAKQAGLEPILGGLKDGDGVWLDCDVHGGLEKFAQLVVNMEKPFGWVVPDFHIVFFTKEDAENHTKGTPVPVYLNHAKAE